MKNHIYQTNINQNKAVIAILLSDKIGFRQNNFLGIKKYCIMINFSIYPDANHVVSKKVKQN